MIEKFDKYTLQGLRRASLVLGKTKRSNSSLQLLDEILRHKRDLSTLKAYYWAAMSDFNLLAAAKTLQEIREVSGGDKKSKLWLAKASSAPLEGLTLTERLAPTAKPEQIAPILGRVLYLLHNSLPYSSGGYATRAHGMAKALRNAGVDIICCTRPGYPHDIPGDHDGHQLDDIDTIDGIPYYRIWSPLRAGIIATDYMSQAADALKDMIRQVRPAVVISASNHATALPACIAARHFGLPFVYEVRGFWEITRISREPEFVRSTGYKMQVFFESSVAKAADHVLTLTGPMRDELIARGVEAEQVTLAPNSCDPSHFSPRARDEALAASLGIPAEVPVIGYIGSFVQYEGLEHLVEAAVNLRDRGHDFRLMLVGNENASGSERGPITQEILDIAKRENLGDRLIMPGRVPHEQVDAYYSLIDIAPFPRKPQPVTEMVSPMKPLEAFAMEKAVVVSSVKALSEMVQHDVTGLVFEKGNVGAMADTLARLIDDPALRKRLGKAGRTWVEQERTWKRTAEKALADLSARNVPVYQAGTPAIGAEFSDGEVPTAKKNQSSDASPLYIDADGVPNMSAGQAKVYDRVKAKFDARDKKDGKVKFSRHDWLRTKTAFALFGKARNPIDIGIGQGQLINLFCEMPYSTSVVGVDRVKNTKLIAPRSEKYDFVSLDITQSFPPDLMRSDITIAMEIFEHLDADKLSGAIARSRASSRFGMLFASVPYQEKHPLYHHDKPFGHKQSFDDAKVYECFGDEAIWTNFNNLWYLIFMSEGLETQGSVSFEHFANLTRKTFDARMASESERVGA